mmetsp:Transcript_7707/g.16736  ORF Transcript_7707/g.16736 Transcript_7707/m.16736 type:complete len:204 (+) Transcript_7707:268-879(+)
MLGHRLGVRVAIFSVLSQKEMPPPLPRLAFRVPSDPVQRQSASPRGRARADPLLPRLPPHGRRRGALRRHAAAGGREMSGRADGPSPRIPHGVLRPPGAVSAVFRGRPRHLVLSAEPAHGPQHGAGGRRRGGASARADQLQRRAAAGGDRRYNPVRGVSRTRRTSEYAQHLSVLGGPKRAPGWVGICDHGEGEGRDAALSLVW